MSEPRMARPWKNLPPLEDRLLRRMQTHLARRTPGNRFCSLVQLPVEPGQLVVLAVGVVVAVLRVAQLVAAAEHRHALREQQRGHEVALLPLAQSR